METHILRPGPNDAGKRIDRVLRICFPGAGLGALFAAIRKGDVRVDGKKTNRNYRVREGDEITVKKTAAFFQYETHAPAPRKAAAAGSGGKNSGGGFPVTTRVIFEDGNFLVLDKPRGVLSHGPQSLAEDVTAYLAPRLSPSLAFSPAPLHRLDRNTSGVIFFSKSIEGARVFSAALREGSIRKTYYALLEGSLTETETWTDSLLRDGKARVSRAEEGARPGKTAVSEVRPLSGGRGLTLCEVRIQTGRTHQIRVQAAAHGHPLAGDLKYGGRPLPEAPRGAYILHAAEILLPASFTEVIPRLNFRAPLPDDARRFLREAGLRPPARLD